MSRFLIDDPTKTDPRAALNVVKMALLTDIVAPVNKYLYASGQKTLTIADDVIISTTSGGVFRTTSQTIGETNLDTGAEFIVGRDYYVYLCDPGSGLDERYVVSLNSTYPAGYDASNGRKIGGFHYGVARHTNAVMQPTTAGGTVRGSGWEAAVFTGIVPRSVWTLKHRPTCSPEGMVFVSDFWADIYLSSDDGAGALRSAYGQTPVTGTEGLTVYDFIEKYAAVGKRVPTYEEWLMLALGSPGGLADSNLNAWSASSNTGRALTGSVERAVSSFGVRDAVGNVWEHTIDFFARPADKSMLNGSGTFPATDGYRAGQAYTNGNGHYHASNNGVWAWDTVSPFGEGYGNIYEYNDNGLMRLVCGGPWDSGTQCGARSVFLNAQAWVVYTRFGGRGVCDCL